jgi:hypothetical protein
MASSADISNGVKNEIDVVSDGGLLENASCPTDRAHQIIIRIIRRILDRKFAHLDNH